MRRQVRIEKAGSVCSFHGQHGPAAAHGLEQFPQSLCPILFARFLRAKQFPFQVGVKHIILLVMGLPEIMNRDPVGHGQYSHGLYSFLPPFFLCRIQSPLVQPGAGEDALIQRRRAHQRAAGHIDQHRPGLYMGSMMTGRMPAGMNRPYTCR